jgi:hypothetical protein
VWLELLEILPIAGGLHVVLEASLGARHSAGHCFNLLFAYHCRALYPLP